MQKKLYSLFILVLISIRIIAQDSTLVSEFDASQYEDGSTSKTFCTQKVLNQTPTKQISIGYEMSAGFKNKNIDGIQKIKSMSGLRTNLNLLAVSTNKLLVNVGMTYWGSSIKTNAIVVNPTLDQIYSNRMDIEGMNVLVFKPLNDKHFIIFQANVDASFISSDDTWKITTPSLTFYGSAIYGWKKGDYRMMGIGLSRTYRLGRPIIVPILLYNQTFNDRWGIESLLPARAHLRYNVSANTILLGGYELEGQQFDVDKNNHFLQRGEIKPRFVIEKKVKGFIWLSAQLGYRINGRFNVVNSYDGQEKNEIYKNTWGSSPYFNISFNFVTP